MTGSDRGRFAKGIALLRNESIGDLVRRAGAYAQHHGWILWSTEICVMYLRSLPETAGVEAPAGTVFSLAELSDLAAMVACAGEEEDSAHLFTLFAGFFAAGHRCAVARNRHGIAGYLWEFRDEYVLTLDAYGPHSMQVKLEPNAVFTGNAYVRPDSRRHGLYRNLKHFLMRQSPPETAFYTWINRQNTASLGANRNLGFTLLATLRFVGLGSGSALWWRPADSARWLRAGLRWPAMTIQLSGARMTIGVPAPR